MKSLRIALVLLLAVSIPSFAADPIPTATDQEKLLQHLQRTRDLFLASVEGLSEAQWNYKPAPDKWSVAECAEHIAASETLIRGAVEKSLAAPAAKSALKQQKVTDDVVVSAIVDRTKKFSAPEPLVPANRFGGPAAAVEAFRKEREETLKLAEGDKDLRKYAAQHPGFGMLDAHGWMLFLSAHTERHTLQIEEVKSSDGFPVK
ncbi:MAG TPA: DinB family protein [Thermoanaerobaculia bacterium]|nr:DinB family protein [Thermoanaerobaculia bacterium]